MERLVNYFSSIALALLFAGAVILLGVIYWEEGVTGVWHTLRNDVAGVLWNFKVVLAVFFVITGAINHLQERHPQKFQDIMAGKWGTAPVVLLAAAMPGPAGGEQLQKAWSDRATNRLYVLLGLVGMMGLGMNSLLFRARVLGGPLTLIWLMLASKTLIEVWLVMKFRPWTWFR